MEACFCLAACILDIDLIKVNKDYNRTTYNIVYKTFGSQ